MSDQILKLGIPAGSLKNATVDLFAKAGFHILDSSRSYLPRIDDEQIQITMLRAQEMSKYVEDGVIDAGITGYDWILENGSDVVEICELAYSKATSNPARWVLAVPAEAQASKPEDLAGGIVATELVNVTKKYFADKGVDVKVEFSWGATECNSRAYRNRNVTAGKQSANNRHHRNFHNKVLCESAGLARQVQTRENGEHFHTAQRGNRGSKQGRLEDEHKEGQPRCDPEDTAG